MVMMPVVVGWCLPNKEYCFAPGAESAPFWWGGLSGSDLFWTVDICSTRFILGLQVYTSSRH